jgi:plastocyanin
MRFMVLLLLSLLTHSAFAAEEVKEYKLYIRDHRFAPAEVIIPANTKIKLLVINEDATAEEFESHELNREKVVAGKNKISVFIGPLKPGRYPFFGEFHQATAQGAVIVK